MTKQEKRLFIREVAKELYCRYSFSTYENSIREAQELADELEALERKQDEEEAKRPVCFGTERADNCRDNCAFLNKCKTNRGAK